MTAACIGSTDCIELISPAGVLNANLILNPSPCNGITCTPTGVLVVQAQFTSSVVMEEFETDVANGDGEVLVMALAITYTTPDCGDAKLFVGIDWGTLHVTDLTPGGRLIFTERVDTGAGFNDTNYGVLNNNGASNLEHAFPGRATITTGDVAGNFTQTITIRRVVEITSAGDTAHVISRACFIYVWSVTPA